MSRPACLSWAPSANNTTIMTNNIVEGLSSQEKSFSSIFLAGVKEVLGDNLHSCYLYGASMFPHPVLWRVDFDYHIIIKKSLPAAQAHAMLELYKKLNKEGPLGEELDGYCVSLGDARLRDLPRDQVLENVYDYAWALHRAHIHAGRFLLLYGQDPREFLPAPEWAELDAALEHELEFVKENPQDRNYGVLNLCRLLYSRTTKDVVTSKYQAGQWALDSLDGAWRPVIEAALRDYEDAPKAGDEELVQERYPDFLAFAVPEIERMRLPK